MSRLNLDNKTTKGSILGLVSLVILALAIWLSFDVQLPSPSQYTSGNKGEFSQHNALKHLKAISQKPHYLGSPAHAEVRHYLVNEMQAMGLEVEVFEHMATHVRRQYVAAKTKNIIAKIPGKSSGSALVLLSHYDSAVHSSLGASDAGSGVVTILEGVRSFLSRGEIPQNDIIIVLSDGEERGLLGAQAFVNYHPWAAEVKVVLNFEARGSGGPSYMILETNGGNAQLVKAFAEAKIAHPAANSLMYSIYKLLPNDTDLTVFREDGNIQGYNFAFIDDHFDYHTAQDSVARLDKNTLNHQAEYLIAMLDYFADGDLNQLRSEEDWVYFNFPVIGMLSYPFAWVLTMALVGIAILLGLCYVGIKAQRLSLPAMAKGFVPLSLSLLAAGLIGYLAWLILLLIFPQYADIPQNFTYNGHWLIATFVALSIASTLGIYQWFARFCSGHSLYVAPIVLWSLLNLYLALALPGAGFLIIPTYCAMATLGLRILSKNDRPHSAKHSIIAVLLSLPGVTIIAPLIAAFVIGLGLNALFIGTLLTALLSVLVLPVVLDKPFTRGLKRLAGLLALIFFTVSVFQSSYSPERKKPNSINYLLDADQQLAFWISSNRSEDEFTKQFFSQPQNAEPWDRQHYPDGWRSKIRQYQQAEVLPLAQASILVEQDKVVAELRHVTLRISPNRATNLVRLFSQERINIKQLSVNGQRYEKHNQAIQRGLKPGFFFNYTLASPMESFVIEFTLPASEPLSIKLYESAFDLFETFPKTSPRGPQYMPEPFILNDSTIIGQKVKLTRILAK